MELTTNAAASNSSKNRYRNILTCKVVLLAAVNSFVLSFTSADDHARVILKAVPGTEPLKCDYIAAAYVDVSRVDRQLKTRYLNTCHRAIAFQKNTSLHRVISLSIF